MVHISRIADVHNHTDEWPLWHPDEQQLYWVDIPAGQLYRYDPIPEINWSEVTRQAIDEKIAALERLERIDEVASMSEATSDDAKEIADLVNRGLAQRQGIEDDAQSDE